MEWTRRRLLTGSAAAAVGWALLPRPMQQALKSPLLYPPMDLSYFDTPIASESTGVAVAIMLNTLASIPADMPREVV